MVKEFRNWELKDILCVVYYCGLLCVGVLCIGVLFIGCVVYYCVLCGVYRVVFRMKPLFLLIKDVSACLGWLAYSIVF